MRFRLWASCLILPGSITGAAMSAAAQQAAAPVPVAAPNSAATAEAAFLAANRAKPGVVQTASGLQYQVTAEGEGASPTDDDVVLVNYVARLADGTVFDQSAQPTPMPVGGVVPGFSEALKLMRRGGKYRLWIPAGLGYGSKGSGPIPPNTTLLFDVELLDFLPKATIEKYQRDMAARAAATATAGTAFLTQNRAAPGVTETTSGLQYKILTPASGPHPTDADVAMVNYDGKLLDGTTFDKSIQPMPMRLSGVVPGFSEALKLMAKGEKLRVWIPPRLAYGAEDQSDSDGKVVIPANSTLMFDIELVDVRPQS